MEFLHGPARVLMEGQDEAGSRTGLQQWAGQVSAWAHRHLLGALRHVAAHEVGDVGAVGVAAVLALEPGVLVEMVAQVEAARHVRAVLEVDEIGRWAPCRPRLSARGPARGSGTMTRVRATMWIYVRAGSIMCGT